MFTAVLTVTLAVGAWDTFVVCTKCSSRKFFRRSQAAIIERVSEGQRVPGLRRCARHRIGYFRCVQVEGLRAAVRRRQPDSSVRVVGSDCWCACHCGCRACGSGARVRAFVLFAQAGLSVCCGWRVLCHRQVVSFTHVDTPFAGSGAAQLRDQPTARTTPDKPLTARTHHGSTMMHSFPAVGCVVVPRTNFQTSGQPPEPCALVSTIIHTVSTIMHQRSCSKLFSCVIDRLEISSRQQRQS